MKFLLFISRIKFTPAGAPLPPACLLIQAGRPEKGNVTPRPASVPLQLDLLQSELAGLAEKRDSTKEKKEGKEGRTKKISLPASVGSSATKDLGGSTSKKVF